MSSIIKPTLGSQINLGHPLANGFVGCWLFNEGSGGQIYDLSGNGNTGILIADTHWVLGKFGSALDFDAIGDYVDCAVVPTISKDLNWSVSVWANADSIPLNRLAADIIWANSIGSSNRIGLNIFNGEVVVGIYNGSSYFVVKGAPISVNTWYHIVVTYNGTVIRLWINGVESTAAPSDDPTLYATEKFYIGARTDGTKNFDGTIDNVMVYNRALTASEITLLYREPFCMFERDPIELWSAATLGAPPVGMAGAMTTNSGYWGW